MFKTTALGSIANEFINKNGGDGTLVDADDGNIHQDEIVNAVESGSRTLDPAGNDRSQLAEAMAVVAGRGIYHISGGGPVAYTLIPHSSDIIYPAEVGGMNGVILLASFGSTNSGACTIDWNGTGPIQVLKGFGGPLTGGELNGWVYLFYSSALSAWYFMYSAENIAVADEAITMSKLNNGAIEGDNVRTRQILAFATFKSNNGSGQTIIYNSFNVLSISREPTFAGNHVLTLKTGLSTAFGTALANGSFVEAVADGSQSSVTIYNYNPTVFQLQCFLGASTEADFDIVTFMLLGKL
jgi:hypothetical protein